MDDRKIGTKNFRQPRFNLRKKSRSYLSREQEEKLNVLWKFLFTDKGVTKFLSVQFQEHGVCLRTVKKVEILLGDLLSAWLIPPSGSRARRQEGWEVPRPSARSLGEIRDWLVRVEELVFPVLRPYAHDFMQDWPRREVNSFFHDLLRVY